MEFRHELIKTSDLTEATIINLEKIFNSAFESNENYQSHFQWKYCSNPMGDSRHLLSYADDQLVGVRSFWRLFEDQDLLQCVDTSVAHNVQKLGVFKSGTEFLLKHNIKMYNFPNSKSLRQYSKYGWVIRQKFKSSLTTFRSAMDHCVNFDTTENFLSWRYTCHPKFKYKKYRKGLYNYIFRMKKSIPILLFKTLTDIELPTIKPIFCVVYSNIPGVSIAFGDLTYAISRDSTLFDLNPYLMDML